ncbi:unnamed protein product [Linum tenue]|uniref:Uncharacterized protein n=1 Tax=Linum tenue TaxID=586396 RepID=A0AAV0KJE6_9ROSI|nr:unnamed protein product [Linum tenue]
MAKVTESKLHHHSLYRQRILRSPLKRYLFPATTRIDPPHWKTGGNRPTPPNILLPKTPPLQGFLCAHNSTMQIPLLLSCLILAAHLNGAVSSSPSESVNIGVVLSFGSIIGKVSKIAIQAAVADVNSDPSVLPRTKLLATVHDTNFSGFLGIVEGNAYLNLNLNLNHVVCSFVA